MSPKPAWANRPAPAAVNDTPWLSPKQAADYLGVSLDMIYAACQTKGLKYSKLGHSTLRLRREWIDEWVQSRVHGHE